MSTRLIITVEFDNDSDRDFVRHRMVAAVEEVADEYEDNLDGPVAVDWDLEEDA